MTLSSITASLVTLTALTVGMTATTSAAPISRQVGPSSAVHDPSGSEGVSSPVQRGPLLVASKNKQKPSRGSRVIERVSTSATGEQAVSTRLGSSGQDWSPDGKRIAFTSFAWNLVPGDTNGVPDVFVKTLATGAIKRISTNSAGKEANSGSDGPAWSPDGRRIAFTSDSPLVPGDTNGHADVYVKTLATGALKRISIRASGRQGNDHSQVAVWSPNGKSIAFMSDASNLVAGDTNGSADVFVKTLATGALQRISTDAAGGQANDESSEQVWSPDGRSIAFSSYAENLVPDDNNESRDVFVKTLATGAIQRVSTDATGQQVDAFSWRPQWSPDGARIAFDSGGLLVPGDNNESQDVFVKTLATGAIQRISTDPSGAQVNDSSFSPVWSPDGSSVAFESYASNLISGDTNDDSDVFVKTLSTGAIKRISITAAGGQANRDSFGPVWSPDGTRVAFYSSASNLVPHDTNRSKDVFVRKVS